MTIGPVTAATIGMTIGAASASALTARVERVNGSPTLLVNGKPRAPLMFFGWAQGAGPTLVNVSKAWRQYHVSFVAPEDNEGHCGVHVRVSTQAGAVWVDDARFYEGRFRPQGGENRLRCGDWEQDRATVEKAWTLFVKREAGAKADWQPDTTTYQAGKQSCKITIEHPGGATWHVHLYQTGLTVKKGKRYTFSLWLKGDTNRQVEIQALHHGPPWRIYSGAEDSPTREEFHLAAAAGVHMHSFGIAMPWPRPGKAADFSRVDEAIEQVLSADPDALLLPRFGVDPPGWWYDAHPTEALKFDDGRRRPVCVASTIWRKEMVERVRALVAHCERKYGDHMLGYHPCAQHTGEWFYPRTWAARHSGFSPAMQRGFARWLKQKYATVDALRKAWSQPDARFEDVAVPTVEQRRGATLGVFRDPARERWIIDFHDYHQVAMVEPLELIAPVIKQQTRRRKLVVFFYGYLFEISGLPLGPQTSGHLALARLLRCPDVDIVCSPISYGDRGLGGIGAFMVPVDSVRASGKLWLNEDDTRTHLTPENAGYGRVATPQHTYWVHQRNFGQIFPRRLACWYMDLGGTGWLAGRDIWDQIARLRRIYDEHVTQPARWSPEVAVIVDEASPSYLACNATVMRPLLSGMRGQFYRMGAPFSMYLLSDMVAGRVPPARVYLFVGCFHMTSKARQAVARQVRGRTAVWFYGSGYLSDHASVDQMSKLVGMQLSELKDSPNGMVTVQAQETALTAGIACTRFGTPKRLAPVWAVEQGPGVEVIGRFEGKHIAAAAAKIDGGRSVYIGTVAAPAALLRNIIRAGGAHVYIETDDVLLTDGQFLSITASKPGCKVIRLPSVRRVFRLPGHEQVGESTDRVEAKLAHGETRLYWLEKRGRESFLRPPKRLPSPFSSPRLQVADDFFDEVLDRDDAEKPSLFVDHAGQGGASALHGRQGGSDALVGLEEERRGHEVGDRAERLARGHLVGQDVEDVDQADHLVGAGQDGHPGVVVRFRQLDELAPGCIDRHGADAAAIDHGRADADPREVHDPVDDGRLFVGKDAYPHALAEHGGDPLPGSQRRQGSVPAEPDAPGRQPGQRLEQRDDTRGPEHQVTDPEGPDQAVHQVVGLAAEQVFGGHLAEDEDDGRQHQGRHDLDFVFGHVDRHRQR